MGYSPKNRLTSADWQRWFKNARLFLAPLALLYLLPILAQVSADPTNISLETFRITPEVRGAIVLYVLNATIDIINKFKNENSYKE